MPTWFDLALRQPDESWRALRRRRATAPAAATSPERAATFRSALEQAEQQMRAAASIGYDSRALNLFYGLSQGGRALAAASPALSDEEFLLSGHGLKSSYPSQGLDVTAVQVRPAGGERTSFQRLSTVLGSPLIGPLTLGQLWPLMFETTMGAPLGDLFHPPLTSFIRLWPSPNQDDRHVGVDVASLTLPAAVLSLPVAQRPSLADFLARYPALEGGQVHGTSTSPPGGAIPWPEDGQVSLQWPGVRDERVKPMHVLADRLTTYRGEPLAMPTVGECAVTLHPLMVWWQVLYALSMLTRYEPARWTSMINIDAHEQTVAIEFVLDMAVAAIPDLLDEALDQLARPARSTTA